MRLHPPGPASRRILSTLALPFLFASAQKSAVSPLCQPWSVCWSAHAAAIVRHKQTTELRSTASAPGILVCLTEKCALHPDTLSPQCRHGVVHSLVCIDGTTLERPRYGRLFVVLIRRVQRSPKFRHVYPLTETLHASSEKRGVVSSGRVFCNLRRKPPGILQTVTHGVLDVLVERDGNRQGTA